MFSKAHAIEQFEREALSYLLRADGSKGSPSSYWHEENRNLS